MQYKRIILCVSFLLGTGLTGMQAQEGVNASGGDALGSGGSVSYSVGQITYTTATGSNGYSVAEGVQQPFEISVVNGLEESKIDNLHLSLYPNPVNDILTIKVDNTNEKVSYQLYDIKGELLRTKELISLETQIQTNSLAPSTYFLKVVNENETIKTFKVIKN